MEHASALPEMSWQKNLRSGQRKTVDLFGPGKTKVVTQLPTGYGKTLTAACCYLQAKATIGVNRVLYIAPKSGQVTQAADEFPRAIQNIVGGSPKSHVVGENPITALKAHRKQAAEIFITTVQALVTSEATFSAVMDMLATGRWMIVIDEHHHYGDLEDSAWTKKVLGLPALAVLAMSATPSRSDGSSPIGEPDVKVKYREALAENAVKKLNLHVYEYRIDAITVNGDVIPFTTSDLFREVGSSDAAEIERFLASRQMKWSPKYISPLVLHPLERLNDLFINKSIKGQMLVQAMSCSHAKTVCEQIKAIIPKNVTVDWCGTGPNGRSFEENAAVIEAFCPSKDAVTGKRKWTLDILVNVGIASEGLDTNDVCEVVFLTSPKVNNTTLQTIGRGARLHQRAARNDQPTCTINVDSSSELAEYVGSKIMDIFDLDAIFENAQDEAEEPSGKGENDYDPLPDDMPQVGVLDVTLVDIRTDPMFLGVLDLTEKAVTHLRLTPEEKETMLAKEVERQVREFMRKRDERFDITAIEAQTREKVDAAVRKVAGAFIRKASGGMSVEKTAIGDIVRRINTQKKFALGPVDRADVSELEKHWRWIKQVEAQILSGEVPQWLR